MLWYKNTTRCFVLHTKFIGPMSEITMRTPPMLGSRWKLLASSHVAAGDADECSIEDA